jgi:CoA-transferase family III
LSFQSSSQKIIGICKSRAPAGFGLHRLVSVGFGWLRLASATLSHRSHRSHRRHREKIVVPHHYFERDFALKELHSLQSKRDQHAGACSDRQFVDLCKILGREALVNDPMFQKNPERVQHREELIAELSALFLPFQADELI